MTDLERFVETYRAVGIELKVSTTEEGSVIILAPDYDQGSEEEVTVGFCGYGGFYSKIEFDKSRHRGSTPRAATTTYTGRYPSWQQGRDC